MEEPTKIRTTSEVCEGFNGRVKSITNTSRLDHIDPSVMDDTVKVWVEWNGNKELIQATRIQ